MASSDPIQSEDFDNKDICYYNKCWTIHKKCNYCLHHYTIIENQLTTTSRCNAYVKKFLCEGTAEVGTIYCKTHSTKKLCKINNCYNFSYKNNMCYKHCIFKCQHASCDVNTKGKYKFCIVHQKAHEHSDDENYTPSHDNKLTQEPIQEQVQNQVSEPISEPVQEPIQEPIQNQVSAPIQNQVSAPVQNQVSAPVQNQVSVPVQNQVSEPVQEPITEAMNDLINQVMNEPISEPVNDNLTESIYNLINDNIESRLENIQNNINNCLIQFRYEQLLNQINVKKIKELRDIIKIYRTKIKLEVLQLKMSINSDEPLTKKQKITHNNLQNHDLQKIQNDINNNMNKLRVEILLHSKKLDKSSYFDIKQKVKSVYNNLDELNNLLKTLS